MGIRVESQFWIYNKLDAKYGLHETLSEKQRYLRMEGILLLIAVKEQVYTRNVPTTRTVVLGTVSSSLTAMLTCPNPGFAHTHFSASALVS